MEPFRTRTSDDHAVAKLLDMATYKFDRPVSLGGSGRQDCNFKTLGFLLVYEISRLLV